MVDIKQFVTFMCFWFDEIEENIGNLKINKAWTVNLEVLHNVTFKLITVFAMC